MIAGNIEFNSAICLESIVIEPVLDDVPIAFDFECCHNVYFCGNMPADN
jgi:hypothetical protein